AAAAEGDDQGQSSSRKRRRRRRPRRRKSGAEVDQNASRSNESTGDQTGGDQTSGKLAGETPAKPDQPARRDEPRAEGRAESRADAPAEPAEAPRDAGRHGRPDREAAQAGSGASAGRDGARVLASDVVASHRVTPFGTDEAADPVALLTRAATSLMVRSGFQTRVNVEEGDYHEVKMVVDDRSAGVLIGRQGSTVDAVEHLVERIATRTVGERVKLNLDINNYRLRREDGLLGRSRRAIMEARETGEPVAMEPAGGRDRRIVHLEVAEEEDLVTYTEIGEDGKYVVICRPEQVPDEHRDPELHGPAPTREDASTAAAAELATDAADEDVEVEIVAEEATEDATAEKDARPDEVEEKAQRQGDA
ncbi:KH domain-containing protein, partial [bacterium]|nr:KH domain-containing protein [bacterium]